MKLPVRVKGDDTFDFTPVFVVGHEELRDASDVYAVFDVEGMANEYANFINKKGSDTVKVHVV